jgi:hypothetical protein
MINKLINHFVSWLSVFLIYIFFQQIFRSPWQIYFLAVVILLINFGALWQLTGRKFLSRKLWQLSVTPTLFLLSSLLFVSFLEGRYLRQVFLLGVMALEWAFLEVVFLKINYRPRYQPHSLDNICTHINLITIFLTVSGIFSLIIFLGFSLWPWLMVFGIISFLINYQLILPSDVDAKIAWPYILISTLIDLEIFWAVSYLPVSVYVSGLLVTVSYYFTTGLARNWLIGVKEKRVVIRYLIISLSILILVLVSAKWF